MNINLFIKKYFILFLILFFGFLLRVYNLDVNPPSLTSDEAALGYNAYSISKTLKDEHGVFLPIIFQSFGDYKPGLYVYFIVPFVIFLGLTDFAIRFPSVLLGTLSIFLTYRLSYVLFSKKTLAIFSAFSLAFMPWHIHFSRGAWEVNLAFTLLLLALLLFFLSFKRNSWLVFSALCFALSLWSYQGAKILVPLIIFSLLIFSKQLFLIKKHILLFSLITFFLVSLPILFSLFSPVVLGRATVTSVFSYPPEESYIHRISDDEGNPSDKIVDMLFHSNTLFFAQTFLTRFYNHISPRFLFFDGDWAHPRHSPPYHGMLLVTDSVFVVLGFLSIVKHGERRKQKIFLLLFFIISITPAAITRDSIHAVRSFEESLFLALIIGFGLYWLYRRIPRLIFFPVFFFSYIVGFIYYADMYYVHQPIEHAVYWQYGYKEIMQYVIEHKTEYKHIKIQQSYDQPYIYYLLYGKYDPIRFQQQNNFIPGPNPNDVGVISQIDDIQFSNIDFYLEKNNPKTLLVVPFERVSLDEIAHCSNCEIKKEIINPKTRLPIFYVISIQ